MVSNLKNFFESSVFSFVLVSSFVVRVSAKGDAQKPNNETNLSQYAGLYYGVDGIDTPCEIDVLARFDSKEQTFSIHIPGRLRAALHSFERIGGKETWKRTGAKSWLVTRSRREADRIIKDERLCHGARRKNATCESWTVEVASVAFITEPRPEMHVRADGVICAYWPNVHGDDFKVER
jgi:hypothetical protein